MTTDTITADPLIHQHVFLGQGHEQSERKTWAVISFAVRADFSRTATDGRDDVLASLPQFDASADKLARDLGRFFL